MPFTCDGLLFFISLLIYFYSCPRRDKRIGSGSCGLLVHIEPSAGHFSTVHCWIPLSYPVSNIPCRPNFHGPHMQLLCKDMNQRHHLLDALKSLSCSYLWGGFLKLFLRQNPLSIMKINCMINRYKITFGFRERITVTAKQPTFEPSHMKIWVPHTV